MPFISSTDGDLKSVFITDAWLLDQYVGNSFLAWGLNGNGQIGDNGTSSYSLPTQTVATGINWKQASAGDKHTVGVKTDGTLWSWGNNAYGQLGDNSLVHRSSPVQTFAGGTNWNYVGSGWNHNIATKTDGTLWVWGRNNLGQLGNQNTTNSLLPKQILGTDPNYNQNVLLIRADGTNNGQNNTFLDSSSNNFTVTRNGNTTQGTFNPFGTNWSNYFDGNGDYLTFASNSAYAPGTGDFTVECWVNYQSLPTSGNHGPICQNDQVGGSTNDKFYVSLYNNGGTLQLIIGRHSTATFCPVNWVPSIGVWYHIAVVRQSGTILTFINGVSQTVTSSTALNGVSFGQNGFAIGAISTPYYGNLYISNFRYIVGTAYYTSTFTPPTSNLTKIANTQILCCQDNRFVDNSNNGAGMTRSGDVAVTNFGPFLPTSEPIGNSGYFDGNGDYLTLPSNSAFDVGSGDFTVEFWIYSLIAPSDYQRVLTVNGGSGYSNESIIFEIASTGISFGVVSGSTGYGSGAQSFTAGQWYHLALSRSGSNLRSFINGALVNTTTFSGTVNFAAGAYLFMGAWAQSGSYSRFINAYLSSIRFVKGTGLYTASFTPSTAPLGNVSGTSALLNFSNANIFDATGMNDLETVGDVKVSTSVVKYGSGSMAFDGNGDYLIGRSNPNLDFGTGDFTIEAWVYFAVTPTSAYMGVVQGTTAITTVPGTAWNLTWYQTGSLRFGRHTDNSNTYVTANWSPSANTWYHVAVARKSGIVTIYINGIAYVSASYTLAMTQEGLTVGATYNGNYWNGYIDDLRIIKGFAKYTSNFIPPAQGSPDDPYYNQTVLLLSGNGNDAGNNSSFLDSSANNFAVTRNGNTTQGSFSPYGTTWSNFFDGNGDYLSGNSNANLAIGTTEDWTIECWVNFTSTNYGAWYQSTNNTSAANGQIWFGYYTGGLTVSQHGSNTYMVSYAWTPTLGIWYHVAATRTSGTTRLFINGNIVTTSTIQNGIAFTQSGWAVGLLTTPTYYNGYISNLRFIKGTSLYSSAFIPPVSNLANIANVQLLTCQSNRFIDNSNNSLAITRNGDVRVTSFSPFRNSTNEVTTASKLPLGYFSNYFDGTGDYVSTPSTNAFSFGTNNFTIEGWFFATAGVSTWKPIMSIGTNAAGQLIRINQGISSTGYYGFLYPNSSNNGDLTVNTGTAFPTNQWVHLALVRNGTNLTLYANGTQVAQATSIGFNFTNTTGVTVGYGMYIADGYFAGYASNIRIVSGTALYTGNFTAPTAPFTAIPNTQLLTCQASRLLDASTNNFTITRSGDVSVQSFVPFAATTIGNYPVVNGSAFFDGASDYLSLPTSSAFQFGTGNFTLEFWVYKTGTSEAYARYFQTANNDVYTAFTICQDNTNQNGLAIAFSSNGSSWDIVNTTISGIVLDAWTHFALVRNGTNISCYINGIGTSLVTTSASLYYNASETIIVGGQGSPSRSLRAFISNLRVLKGTALYTSNFTPPTSPLTAITNTSLLLNFNNGQIIDSTGDNVAETIGTARVSTSITKYGSGAMYFAGNGNYLKLPHTPDLSLGSGDWTMECWVYITSAVNYNGIICKRSSGTYDAYNFGTDASNNLWLTITNSAGTWTIGGATLATGVTPNVWHHLAVVRSGNLITGFVDGIAGTTPQSFTGSVYDTGQSVYIANTDGGGNGQNFNGYICDFRLTKGVARYTGNFTPAQIGTINNGPTDWKQAAGGSNFTTAVKTDGTLWTWGANSYGQLGDNTVNHRSSPVQTVAGGTNWSKVAAGELHTAGVKTDGTLWLWGKNSYAQIGDGTTTHRSIPTQLVGGDPYFNNTSLLLLGNGTNAGQNNTFLDNSILPLAITRNGNVTQGSFTPYNIYWSNYFDGVDDYLSYTSSTTLNFGTADFTVECWINIPNTTGSKMLVTGTATNAFGFRYGLGLNQNQGLSILLAGNTDLEYCYYNFLPNTWYHVAVVRQSSIIKFFVNGLQQNTYGTGGSTYNFGAETSVYVSTNSAGSEDYIGYISNLRVVKGTAVYTQSFTPSLAPLTAISGTSLLTCATNRFSDSSTNNFAITNNGNTQVTNFHPFRVTSEYNTNANGGSAYFDGTGDSLVIASSPNLAFGTGDFCVEAWVYWTATGVLDAIFNNLTSAGAGDTQFNVQLTTGNKVQVSAWSTLFLTGATNVPSYTWNHIAVCRSGTTLSIFLNGSRDATTTNSNDFSSSNAFYVGDYPVGGAAFSGYISNLRAVKGFSVYDPTQTTITLPTAPLQGIAGTSLLLNFANAQIIDSTCKNILETVGNAQISTSIKKYGTGSIAFDAVGDRLVMSANPSFAFGYSDFTIEFWMYSNDVLSSTQRGFLQTSDTTGGLKTSYTTGVVIVQGAINTTAGLTGGLVANVAGTLIGSSTAVITTGTWYHVALVRFSGVSTLYVNGTAIGSGVTNGNCSGQNLVVGGYYDTNYLYNGYLDELRITTGFARYTSNFTPSQVVPYTSNDTIWKNIACGNNHTSCIKIDDTLWSWGRNNVGQLGDLTYTIRSSPVQTIAGGSNWKQVSAGINFTTAMKTDSTLWSWGSNLYGQLSDGTRTDRNSPTQSYYLSNTWKQIAAGNYHVAGTSFADIQFTPNQASVVDPTTISNLTLYLDAGDVRSYPGSGTTWYDLSGNNYNFTVNASAWNAAGASPAHFNFEGSYGAATRGSDVPNATNGTFLVFTSIKNNTANWRTLTRGNSADHQVIIGYNSNTLGMYDNNSNQFLSCGFDITSLPNPYTQFNCLVWKLSQNSPYYQFAFNGTNFANTITDGNATFNNGFIIIGAYQSGPDQYWGKIGMFLYYSKHLSDTEILYLYNGYRARFGV